VRATLAADLPLEVLPGPSAAVTALVASGLPVDRWRFVGFLPRARRELESLLADAADTLVAFESPRRLAASLAVLAARDPARPVAVCRELTKLHEEVRRGSAAELATHYREFPARGEVVLVCGAAPPGRARQEEALAAVRELVDAGARARPAAAAVAKLTGRAVNDLYRELTGGS
jgi:16S rRNA (cytidine1402-2'-O)-methyltransferase